MWLRWKKVSYFNFVILKLICIFAFMLFRLKFVFSYIYWDLIQVILCCWAVLMWLRWRNTSFFILKLICIFTFKKKPLIIQNWLYIIKYNKNIKFYLGVPFWGLIVMKDALKEVVFAQLKKTQLFWENLK
jgi:hypothetical protein